VYVCEWRNSCVTFWSIIGGGLETSVNLQIGLRIEKKISMHEEVLSFCLYFGKGGGHRQCVAKSMMSVLLFTVYKEQVVLGVWFDSETGCLMEMTFLIKNLLMATVDISIIFFFYFLQMAFKETWECEVTGHECDIRSDCSLDPLLVLWVDKTRTWVRTVVICTFLFSMEMAY
jgi:hypothetical protein